MEEKITGATPIRFLRRFVSTYLPSPFAPSTDTSNAISDILTSNSVDSPPSFSDVSSPLPLPVRGYQSVELPSPHTGSILPTPPCPLRGSKSVIPPSDHTVLPSPPCPLRVCKSVTPPSDHTVLPTPPCPLRVCKSVTPPSDHTVLTQPPTPSEFQSALPFPRTLFATNIDPVFGLEIVVPPCAQTLSSLSYEIGSDSEAPAVNGSLDNPMEEDYNENNGSDDAKSVISELNASNVASSLNATNAASSLNATNAGSSLNSTLENPRSNTIPKVPTARNDNDDSFNDNNDWEDATNAAFSLNATLENEIIRLP